MSGNTFVETERHTDDVDDGNVNDRHLHRIFEERALELYEESIQQLRMLFACALEKQNDQLLEEIPMENYQHCPKLNRLRALLW